MATVMKLLLKKILLIPSQVLLVAQHLRVIFCNKDWDMQHTDMMIQQVVVMYLNADHPVGVVVVWLFVLTSSSGIRNRDVRVAEIVSRELEKTKPDKWGYVQVLELRSPQKQRQVCPGHFWMLKFGKVP